MKTVFIYALCEPGTRTVRYIGMTTRPKKRLKEHLKDSIKTETHLGRWLRSLLGVSPAFVVLSEVPESEGSAEEIRYIAAARTSLGMDLVNSTDGGEGVTKTAEVCAKIRAAKGTPEARARTAEQARARWADPNFRNKMKGVHSSPDYKEKASAAASLRMNLPGAIKKMRATLIEVTNTPEARAKRSLSAKRRWAKEEERKAQSERTKAAWENPETRAALMKTKNLNRKRK